MKSDIFVSQQSNKCTSKNIRYFLWLYPSMDAAPIYTGSLPANYERECCCIVMGSFKKGKRTNGKNLTNIIYDYIVEQASEDWNDVKVTNIYLDRKFEASKISLDIDYDAIPLKIRTFVFKTKSELISKLMAILV